MTEAPATIRRQDYTPPAFLIDTVELDFTLDPKATLVRARLGFRRNPAGAVSGPFRLDGQGLALRAIAIDGVALPAGAYAIGPDGALSLTAPPAAGVLETEVVIDRRQARPAEAAPATTAPTEWTPRFAGLLGGAMGPLGLLALLVAVPGVRSARRARRGGR